MSTELNRVLDIYLDVAAPGGANCLLDSSTAASGISAAGSVSPSLMQGDRFELRLHFRRKDAATGIYSDQPWPAGTGIAIGGKKQGALATGAALLSAGTFVKTVDGDAIFYAAIVDLTAAAVATALGTDEYLTLLVDVEVQDSGNSERLTYRFAATLNRQAMATGDDAVPAVNQFQNYQNATGAWCVRVLNSQGETLVAWAPAGEAP